MTIEQAAEAIEKYRDVVLKQPFSKDMKDHIIEGLGINDPEDKNYDVFVIGQNLNHTFNFLSKPLEQWLRENGHLL